MTFKSLGLEEALLKAVAEKGYIKPSPIQEKAIPIILQGKDILASAQTGTGKTAGFTLPVLQNLSKNKIGGKRKLKVLILTPTRELALQVFENVKKYSKYIDVKSTVIFGGVKAGKQISSLRQGVDVLVATPGRLLDLYSQKVFSFKDIEVFILDEADRMLDMGFIKDINRVMGYMPSKRQNLMFSATFSNEIKKLAQQILKNPVLVETAPQNTAAERVEHKVYSVDKKQKTKLLVKLIKEGKWKQVLIFTRTKHGANRLTQKLIKSGILASAIHGNKSQGARTKALADFKNATIKVLVATDIAARGLDIPLLPYVVNFELPNVPEDYVHRIGRTGRAGEKGDAISLVCGEEKNYQRAIEKLLKQKIPTEIIEGFEPIDEDKQTLSTNTKKKENRNSKDSNKTKRNFRTNNRNKKKQNGFSSKNKSIKK